MYNNANPNDANDVNAVYRADVGRIFKRTCERNFRLTHMRSHSGLLPHFVRRRFSMHDVDLCLITLIKYKNCAINFLYVWHSIDCIQKFKDLLEYRFQ